MRSRVADAPLAALSDGVPNPRRTRRGPVRLLLVLELIALAWGAMSFGAVYPWGYWPLATTCAAIGLLAFPFARVPMRGSSCLLIVIAAVAGFLAVQCIKVPGPLLARWSPARDAFLKRYDVFYALSGGTGWHAISINPQATLIALACFVAFSLLLLGTARFVSAVGPAGFVQGLTGFGLILALVAMAQNLALTGQTGEGHTVYIYGFWPDPYVNKPFGPFINKNNFAGWIIMVLPLALGQLAAKFAAFARKVRPDWRSRILWLSSKDGARAVFAAVAAFAMGVALVMSMSRSGMVAFAVAIIAAAWFAPHAYSGPRVRFARVAASVALLVVFAAWVGTDAIADRFADRADATMIGRVGAWKDALAIAKDFPIVGAGVNTFGTAMVLYQRHDAYNFWEEAHNDYLQLVAEGGVVMSVLLVSAIAVVIGQIRRRFADEPAEQPAVWIRVGAVAGLFAIAFQELVEFSLQIPGNAALFAALLGIALSRPRDADARGRSHGRTRSGELVRSA